MNSYADGQAIEEEEEDMGMDQVDEEMEGDLEGYEVSRAVSLIQALNYELRSILPSSIICGCEDGECFNENLSLQRL